MFRRGRVGKRGQAAMEYVHTYGWVLLSALVIGGALLYFNLSRAEYLVPLDCAFLSGIRCLDADVEETLVSVTLVNEFGFALSNISLGMTGTCNTTANTTDGNPYGNLNVFLPNKQANYVFECQDLTNIRITEHIQFNYTNVETGEQHVKVGKLEYSPTG